MLRIAVRRFDLAMRLACVAGLVLIALAHRPAVPLPADLAAYVLPDGSIPTLCLPDKESDHRVAPDSGCEFCRIASAVMLPVPPVIIWPAPVASGRIAALPAFDPARPAEFGSRSLRGPPANS